MSLPPAPLFLADIFDRYRLQLPDGIINWLTPVWILCLGAAAGLLLCAVLWGILRLISLAPGIGRLTDNPAAKWIAIGALTVVFFVVAFLGYTSAAPGGMPGILASLRMSLLDSIWLVLGGLLGAWLLALTVVTLINPRALGETNIALREGVLWPLFIAAVVMASFGVLGLVIVRKPTDLLDSLVRWPWLAAHGNVAREYTLPAPTNAFDEPPEATLDVNFRKDEIRMITARSNQHLRIRTEPFGTAQDSTLVMALDVPAEEEKSWRREQSAANPFRDAEVTKLYAKNLGTGQAKVTLTTLSQVANPEMMLVPVMAVAIAGIFFTYLLQRAAMPKLAAVALSTAKSEIAQPLYAILMAAGIFGLIVFVFIPYNTFGEDIKQLKDSGLSLILVLCILQAVWAASSSVADEVEGKTALTVLSKPVSRRDFILGKFAGIAWSVGLMCAIFGILLLVTVAYKPVYDYREGTYKVNYKPQNQDPTWHDCNREMVQIVPGIVLAYLETLVIGALSVAISTRLPALANFIISFAIYVLGHLTPLMVQSQVVAQQLPPVVFFGRFIATILPVLDHFNIQASVAAGVPVPLVYLAWSLVYCILYSSVAMLLALTLFEDRDLA